MITSHFESCPKLHRAGLVAAVALAGIVPFVPARVGFAANAAMPPVLRFNETANKVSYRISVSPGVPAANTTVTIDVWMAEVLATPDPTYGKSRPIDDAQLIVYLVGETPEAPKPEKKKKAPAAPALAPFIDARQGFKLPDAGYYGVTFTAPKEGIYGLYLRGTAGKDIAIESGATLSFGVWPLPEGAKRPELPAKDLPEPTLGNAQNGQVLCATLCRQDSAAALPQGKPPVFIKSSAATAMTDAELLKEMVPKAKNLPPIEDADLLYYLRSLHVGVKEFFPNAAKVLAAKLTINDYGRERLKETANITLTDETASSTVLVVYKDDSVKPSHAAPTMVAYTDRVARDQLKKEDRIGYIVFLPLPGEPKAEELALALGREPNYPIVGLVARDGENQRDKAFNKELSTFVGQGSFNDAKSLKKGSKKLQDKLLPIYLRAAELATMYFAEERDFTAFDGAFD